MAQIIIKAIKSFFFFFASSFCHTPKPSLAIALAFFKFWGNIFKNNEISSGFQVLNDFIKVINEIFYTFM